MDYSKRLLVYLTIDVVTSASVFIITRCCGATFTASLIGTLFTLVFGVCNSFQRIKSLR